MTAGTRVATLHDLWDGEMRGVVVDDTPVLLVRVNGRLCAYLNRCPHLGARLSEGRLNGSVLTCRAHHWQYDILTGQGINPASAQLVKLVIETRGDGVFVDVQGVNTENNRIVGPVLLRSAVSRAIAEAICAANPGARVESRGAYLRVSAPSPCVVSNRQVEAYLGTAFHLPGDLERSMPSYRGRLSMTDEEVRWD
jgi:toluene monooxygenase system ferredoxin subunit